MKDVPKNQGKSKTLEFVNRKPRKEKKQDRLRKKILYELILNSENGCYTKGFDYIKQKCATECGLKRQHSYVAGALLELEWAGQIYCPEDDDDWSHIHVVGIHDGGRA